MTSLNLKVPDVNRTEMNIAGIEAITESKKIEYIIFNISDQKTEYINLWNIP